MASNLNTARKQKNDEFYTQLSDIEKELRHYKQHFKGKVVFCNCDDPYESNFFKYFAMHFNSLGLKKLIATCYVGSPIAENEIGLFKDGYIADEPIPKKGKRAIQFRISEIPDMNGDGAIDLRDAELLIKKRHPYRILHGDEKYLAGDFRSKECIELLKEADIVVTNPPFSIAREYVQILMEYRKEFLIIGDLNWITYKEIFPLLKNNLVWLGYNSVKQFMQANGSLKKFGNKLWFTNLDIKKRHDLLDLYKEYDEEEYPKYDNYDAINIDKTAEIPCDYDGIMGVPISFLDKYNPDQFEIIGMSANGAVPNYIKLPWATKHNNPFINGKPIYQRIFIKRKKEE